MNSTNTKQQFILSYISFADQLGLFIQDIAKTIEKNVPVSMDMRIQKMIDTYKDSFLDTMGYENDITKIQFAHDICIKMTTEDVYGSLYANIQKHLLEEEKYLLKPNFTKYLNNHMKPYIENVLLQDFLPIIYQIKDSIIARYNRMFAEIGVRSQSHTKSEPLDISLIPLKLHPKNMEYLQTTLKHNTSDYQSGVPTALTTELGDQLHESYMQKVDASANKTIKNPLYSSIDRNTIFNQNNLSNIYASIINKLQWFDDKLDYYLDNINLVDSRMKDYVINLLKSNAENSISSTIKALKTISDTVLANKYKTILDNTVFKKQDEFLSKIADLSGDTNIKKSGDEIIQTLWDTYNQIVKQQDYDEKLLLIKSDIINNFTDYIHKAVADLKTQIKITDISLIDNANINDTIIKFTESVNSEESAENIQKIYDENVKIIDAKVVVFVAQDLTKKTTLDRFINYANQIIVDNPEQNTLENLNMLINEETDKLLHKLRFLDNNADIQTIYNESVKLLNTRLSVELGIHIYTGILKTIMDNIMVILMTVILIIITVIYQSGKYSSPDDKLVSMPNSSTVTSTLNY